MTKFIQKKFYALVVSLVGFFITLLMVCIFYFQPPVIQQLDYEIYDFFLEKSADNTPHPLPIIIDIDEASIKEFGQWPWSRYLLADLNEMLFNYGASVIAMDIIFAEEDRTSPFLIKEALYKYKGVNIDFVDLPFELYNNDTYFSEKSKEKSLVLGSYLAFDDGDITEEEKLLLEKRVPEYNEFQRSNAISPLTHLLKADSVTLPLEELAQNTHLAFLNANTSDDGITRSMPLLGVVKDKLLPSLALKALMLERNVEKLRLNSNQYGLESIVVGEGESALTIPLSPQGVMNIPYQGAGYTFPYISAKEILNGTVDPNAIKDKIVFIGTSAAGLLDIKSTPLDPFFPGVEAHAHIIDAILSQDFIITPHWAIDLQFCLLILNGIFITYLFAKVRPAYTLATLISYAGFYFIISWYIYQNNYYISPLWQSLLLFLLALSITALRFWWEESDKKRLRNIFGRYVSPEVVSRIVERSDIMLEGEERELSIMFTDVRGFTSISEKLPPQEIVSLLNSYFTPMTALVRNAEGTLDKFIGDAIMAFWNAPLDIENHTEKAVQAAIGMLEELDVINKNIKEKYDFELNMGVGIHFGPAYVGNMGSSDLTSYTVIGDSVNTASRLEGLCSKFGFRIIVSGEVVKQCNINAIPLANLRVKGRAYPIEVFAVLTPKEEELCKTEIMEYLEAHRVYKTSLETKNIALLDTTIESFNTLSNKYNYRPIYKDYVACCMEMKNADVNDWTDIWTLTNK